MIPAQEVVQSTDDGLYQLRWRFWMIYEPFVELCTYAESSRPTRRHKWSPVKGWSGVSWHEHLGRRMTRDEVPLPDEVKQAGVDAFRALIQYRERDKC